MAGSSGKARTFLSSESWADTQTCLAGGGNALGALGTGQEPAYGPAPGWSMGPVLTAVADIPYFMLIDVFESRIVLEVTAKRSGALCRASPFKQL